MTFIPSEHEWLRSHFQQVPDETVAFCGDISGARMLNVGCGEMLTDFGLLQKGVTEIVGLDVVQPAPDLIQRAAARLHAHGFDLPSGYEHRLSLQHYDGVHFPFEDAVFDMIFSWSAFEHVADVPAVLAEIRRVLRPGCVAFIQVFPWFHCRHGSHLSDFIPEPFFHLDEKDPLWVLERLRVAGEAAPERRDFLQGHMYQEYLSLNQYSANKFYNEVRRAGLVVQKARLITYDEDLTLLPPHVPFSDAMISGTKMLLRKP